LCQLVFPIRMNVNLNISSD